MVKKANAPIALTAPKPGKLDLWHKGWFPALYLGVTLVLGSVTAYLTYAKLAADHEGERLRAEVSKHVEQEQRAKDDAQWLRVEFAKDRQRRVELDDLQKSEAAKFGEEVRDLWEKAVKKAAEETQKEASNNPWNLLK